MDVFDYRCLLLDRGEEALLLLLLGFHIGDVMAHLEGNFGMVKIEKGVVELDFHLLMSIDVVRVPTAFALAVDAGLRVDVAWTSLAAARQLPGSRRGVPAPTASSLLRVVRVRRRRRRRRDHIRCRHGRRRRRQLHQRSLEVFSL